MLRKTLWLVVRKTLRRKYFLFFFLCILSFYVYLNGLMKRNDEDKSFHLSWSQREKLLNIAPRQRFRRHMIIKQCHGRPLNEILPKGPENAVSRDAFRHIIVNDEYRFLYCQVPKVATSNWKRIFMVLNGDASNIWQINSADVHNKSREYFRYLHEYTPSEILVRFRTYYKFLFVRHPLERLVSAFRNKFIESYNLTFFKRIYGSYIVRNFRKRENYEKVGTISFLEFIHYILEGSDEVMDKHWRLYDDLCKPCLINYDFVGYFKDLEQDANDILRMLDVTEKVSFPRNLTSRYNVSSSELVKTYFSELPTNLKERFYEKYQNDFEMFGYTMPKDLRKGE